VPLLLGSPAWQPARYARDRHSVFSQDASRAAERHARHRRLGVTSMTAWNWYPLAASPSAAVQNLSWFTDALASSGSLRPARLGPRFTASVPWLVRCANRSPDVISSQAWLHGLGDASGMAARSSVGWAEILRAITASPTASRR
jgi:hypothetical protein